MDSFRECLSADDILLVPRYSNLKSRSEANISSFNYSIPLGNSPMDLISSPELIDLFVRNNLLATLHRYFNSGKEQYMYLLEGLDFIYRNDPDKLSKIDNIIQNTWFSVGSCFKYDSWINYLYSQGIRKFLIDMAHGDSQVCIDTIKYIKDLKDTEIIAGNVATKAGFIRLQKAGAKGIRCGIGGGSICATRINSAFGVPTLTSVMDCAKVKDPEVFLIADGGIKNAGDIVKYMTVGADMVFCGKLLAGTDLTLGTCYNSNKEIVSQDSTEVYYKAYRGMASKEARQGVLNKSSIEGVSGLVKYVGSTEELINDIRMNLQAALSYGGVTNWNDLRKYVKIIRVSQSSIIESQTHVL